ncbi:MULTISPECIES: sulredoxin [unclassified Thermoplasma]|uniref:sulredoxin n=1 Tax=unclassified Thermoplasma TaxID=2684908 RepID=UPI000D8A024A|nr:MULTISPECIES: sulredoxin [unclassified Thermoplasma]PYB69114.1 sulredoxin [Thermoplasma sp. Kam2015]
MVWKKTVSVKALDNAGGHMAVNVDGNIVFIARGKDGLHGLNAVCTHAKCILGIFEEDTMTVKCPCHNARFDLNSGKMIEPPFVAPNAPMDKLGLKVYNVRENGGFLEVDVD